MNEETRKKMQAIFAEQQAKAAAKATPKDRTGEPTPQPPAPKPQAVKLPEVKQEPAPTVKKVKLKSFTIEWQEGSGKFDNTTFTTWQTANKAMTEIYHEHSGAGYLKVKISVLWETGEKIVDRADCSDSAGDFCPLRETIGEYIQKQNRAMYESNLTSREHLSFKDEYLTSEELTKIDAAEFLQTANFVNDIAEEQPELSTVTFDDLMNNAMPGYCTPAAADFSTLNKPAVKQPVKETKTVSIQMVEYSEKSFALIGEGTKQVKEKLPALGGTWNPHLKCGKGWIFSNKRKDDVVKFLTSLKG